MTYQVSRAIDYWLQWVKNNQDVFNLHPKAATEIPTMPIKTWRVEDMRANRFCHNHFLEVVDIYEV